MLLEATGGWGEEDKPQQYVGFWWGAETYPSTLEMPCISGLLLLEVLLKTRFSFSSFFFFKWYLPF
jgi:hypothetical protein